MQPDDGPPLALTDLISRDEVGSHSLSIRQRRVLHQSIRYVTGVTVEDRGVLAQCGSRQLTLVAEDAKPVSTCVLPGRCVKLRTPCVEPRIRLEQAIGHPYDVTIVPGRLHPTERTVVI